jgi:hypothetical protein
MLLCSPEKTQKQYRTKVRGFKNIRKCRFSKQNKKTSYRSNKVPRVDALDTAVQSKESAFVHMQSSDKATFSKIKIMILSSFTLGQQSHEIILDFPQQKNLKIKK